MKKFLFYLIISVFFFTNTAIGQINESGGHTMMRISTKTSDVLKDVEGSPYLFDDFKKGEITMDGKDSLQVFLKYDVNLEVFEIKTQKASDAVYILPLNPATKYHLEDDIYAHRSIDFDGEKITGYFRILFEGEKLSLLEKPSLTFTEPVQARTGYDKDKPGQIKLKKDYYLVFKDGKVTNVRLKEKDFRKALSAAAVKEYSGKNKLKTEKDFQHLLQWYDSQKK